MSQETEPTAENADRINYRFVHTAPDTGVTPIAVGNNGQSTVEAADRLFEITKFLKETSPAVDVGYCCQSDENATNRLHEIAVSLSSYRAHRLVSSIPYHEDVKELDAYRAIEKEQGLSPMHPQPVTAMRRFHKGEIDALEATETLLESIVLLQHWVKREHFEMIKNADTFAPGASEEAIRKAYRRSLSAPANRPKNAIHHFEAPDEGGKEWYRAMVDEMQEFVAVTHYLETNKQRTKETLSISA
jgi:hypothetical protein